MRFRVWVRVIFCFFSVLLLVCGFSAARGYKGNKEPLKLGVSNFEGCNSRGKTLTSHWVFAAPKGICKKSSLVLGVLTLPRGAMGTILSLFPFFSLSLMEFSWAAR